MSIASLLWQNQDELIQSFHIAIIKGMLKTWWRCEKIKRVPQEPDFVAGLVVDSTPLIHSVLSSMLPLHKLSVSTSAVFCHQTPQVSFGSNYGACCELGDILFVYVHTPKVGQPKRNAILFQAKVSSRQPYQIHKNEADQLHLYVDWPDFVYERSSFLTGQRRSVTPKAPHSGAQYLLIDNRSAQDPMSGLRGFKGTYPVGCCMPDESLHDHSDLASELFNLFVFRSGRPFDDKNMAANHRDWSQVVWDLLEAGVKKSFNRKNSGFQAAPRSTKGTVEILDGMFFAEATSKMSCSTTADIIGWSGAQTIYAQDNVIPPNNRDYQRESVESESGVSLVLIETSERNSDE